ncbi:Dicer-like protein 2 [Sporothrix stenoceras]|uniref:Dicer-like protein 2 n=1 Tax=Sporothrix stenoceras TaxID=5173 RepID=A0ABR3ZMW4_9PEZI
MASNETNGIVAAPEAKTAGGGDMAGDGTDVEDDLLAQSRLYQVEMFEESLKRNIIVAMDTGTGKTRIAILRIRAELERSPAPKIVWFLAPTVPLCYQQFYSISSQIQCVQGRIIAGDADIKAWSTQAIWDAALLNIRFVVATHQVLLEALMHGFVTMDSIPLLVFDEEITHINELFAGSISDGDIKWTWKFLKSFHRKADTIYTYLGSWAAEYYVHKIIRRCTHASKRRLPGESEPYLLALLQHVVTKHPPRPDTKKDHRSHAEFYNGLSVRVQKLVEILSNHGAAQPTGIVFVREQPMAAVLAHLISIHPRLSSRYKAGHVVGMSKFQFGRGLDGLLPMAPKDVRIPLIDFRNRKLNLLVATSVIEEGIDIPACNFVVCIDDLMSLKAFIQRRGRARDESSQFHLLLGPLKNGSDASCPGAPKAGRLALEWEALEAEMKSMYEDELREAEDLRRKGAESALEDGRLQPIYGEAKGSQLLPGAAKQHLVHFCSSVSSGPFVDCRPVFKVHKVSSDPDEFRAAVRLPITLPVHLRRAESKFSWYSESDATADAAFQAYKAIHEAGLLNKHLLPPNNEEDALSRAIEGRASVVTVHEQHRPWPDVREIWKTIQTSPSGIQADVYRHTFRIVDDRGIELFEAALIVPCPMPTIPPFQMYWTAHSGRPWTVHISAGRRQFYGHGEDQYHDDDDHANTLLSAAFGHRWPLTDMHRLVRVVCEDERFNKELIASRAFDPQIFAGLERPFSPNLTCLVRDAENAPHFYQDYLPSKPPLNLVKKAYKGFDEAPVDAAYVVVRPWPKIVGMLHRTSNVTLDDDEDSPVEPTSPTISSSTKPYPRVLPASECRVDSLPISYVQLGALLPPLTAVLEVYMVAKELLASTRLNALNIKDISLVATAISAPVARLPTNYEYLEFIGDSILKVTAAANCSAKDLHAPEGHLSLRKDRLVANSRLCRAALDVGLDHFIVSKQWSLRNWKRYCDGLDSEPKPDDAGTATVPPSTPEKQSPPPEMSTKMLADVVEALIGASHADGGMDKALQCIGLFVGDIEWLPLEECRDILYEAAPDKPPCPPPPGLEELLGYTFTKKSLLIQAITHASMPGDQDDVCMERLEFIGDAILDHVIVQTLTSVRPALSHQRMHLLRTTLVNGAFLAFTTNMFTITEPVAAVSIDPYLKGPAEAAPPFQKPLSAFMRHGVSRDMGSEQEAFAERFASKKNDILEQLWTGHTYPWEELMGLVANKFYSDILEAIIGAIWIDSGSVAAAEKFLDTVGILPYLRRAVDKNIHLLHPKEELGTVTGNAKIDYDCTLMTRAEASAALGCTSSIGNPPTFNNIHKRKRTSSHNMDECADENEEEDGKEGSESYSDTSEEDMMDEAEIRHNAIVGSREKSLVYRCRLMFNGKCEIEVNFCNSREEAETRAASMALKAWKLGVLGK